MHFFQEWIGDKAFEVRATVVGDRVFAAAIHANSEAARVDWRADYDALDYAMVEPPAGQYGWLEDALDFPSTSTLADLLTNGARLCSPTLPS